METIGYKDSQSKHRFLYCGFAKGMPVLKRFLAKVCLASVVLLLGLLAYSLLPGYGSMLFLVFTPIFILLVLFGDYLQRMLRDIPESQGPIAVLSLVLVGIGCYITTQSGF